MLRKAGLFALLLALTLLVSGVAQAMPLAGSSRAAESHGIVDRFWDWLEALFQGSSKGQPHAVWAQDGSHIDPNGGPH